MSLAMAAIFTKQPPISNQICNYNIHHKTPFSSCIFRTFKNYEIVQLKYVILKKPMTAECISPKTVSALEQETLIDNCDVPLYQTTGGLHTIFNLMSKWVISIFYSGLILLIHDGLTFWAVIGKVLNIMLSIALKKTLKQERPVSGVSSGHGMPSSHAQTIFYTIVFVIISVIKWQGLSGVTAIFSMLILALGSYISWLRVSERYHTTNQVAVGAVLGSISSVSWFWAWESIVLKAYNSRLWVRILLVVGAACLSIWYITYSVLQSIKAED